MVIEIAHIPIQIDLVYESEFKSINKYRSLATPKYFIRSTKDVIEFPLKAPDKITKFYDLYFYDTHIIQVQKYEQKIIGCIVYKDHNIDVYVYSSCFEAEYLLTQYALVYILKAENKGILFHGSSILYQNKGILFTAKSGTGKSTHASLWRKYGDAITINDDKNIVVLENDELILYPNPWSGKHMLDNNIIARLDTVVFLYQNPSNSIERIGAYEAMKLLLGQIELPTSKNKEVWNKIVDKILEIPLYKYGCNMEKEAYKVLKERLEKDLCK